MTYLIILLSVLCLSTSTSLVLTLLLAIRLANESSSEGSYRVARIYQHKGA